MSWSRSLALLGVVAMFVVSGIATASASAKQCGSGEKWVFCYSTSEEEIGTPVQEVSGTGGEAVLQGTVSGVSAEAKCSHSGGAGVLELLGATKGTIKFLECEVVKPAGCKLSGPTLTANVLDQLTAHPAAVADLFTGSGTEEGFATVTLENSGCTLAGTYVIHGKQKCELPEATSAKVDHTLECKKSGSSLYIGSGESNKFSFKSESKNVELVGTHAGLAWYVSLGE
jgi:hypothetical protein